MKQAIISVHFLSQWIKNHVPPHIIRPKTTLNPHRLNNAQLHWKNIGNVLKKRFKIAVQSLSHLQ